MSGLELPYRNLVEVLVRRGAEPGERAIYLFDRRGKNTERHTPAELLAEARLAAAQLAARGVAPGDRVLLAMPTSWVILRIWSGAILRGALPVMVAPPGTLGSAENHAHRMEGVVERLGAKLLLCDAPFREELRAWGAPRAAAAAVTPEELCAVSGPAPVPDADPDPDQLAFLQLTSGSTGRSRAVMITHRAALHNCAAIEAALGVPFGGSTRGVVRAIASWMPLYHDMGLIGCWLYTQVHALDLWLMRPETFLARPQVWLGALARSGGAITPAPNFAYQACVERAAPAELEGLDLTAWRGAITGAEMIRPETCAAFCRAFAPYRFDPRAFRPCYGMAEGTLCVTCDLRGEGVRARPLPAGVDSGFGLAEVVATGPAVPDMEVRVCAPDGAARPEGTVGEVRFRGPSAFSGYYGDPEATAAGLRDGWVCTGDLGFLYEGELYLTGRTKELLIIHGHNFMPHELEWVAEEATGGGGTERCGAFSVARGADGEQAVLVVEAPGGAADLAALGHDIRVRLGQRLGLPLADLLFVRRGQIPKTTSGKVQRGELRQRYLDGKLERL